MIHIIARNTIMENAQPDDSFPPVRSLEKANVDVSDSCVSVLSAGDWWLQLCFSLARGVQVQLRCDWWKRSLAQSAA